MLLTNCEIELDYSRSNVDANPAAIPPILHAPATSTISGLFHINNTILYVLLVTLSINDIIKFLEKMKQGFKRTVSWKD